MTIIERTLAFRIDEEFHRELKVKLAAQGLTLKSYVLGLIEKDLHPLQTSTVEADKVRNTAEKMQSLVDELFALTET